MIGVGGEMVDVVDVRLDVALMSDDTIVCRCEEVRAVEVRQAISEGATTINDVKRRTRAGMGACQGIFCTRTIAEMLVADGGVAREDIEPMTARPPVRLIPLGALAKHED